MGPERLGALCPALPGACEDFPVGGLDEGTVRDMIEDFWDPVVAGLPPREMLGWTASADE